VDVPVEGLPDRKAAIRGQVVVQEVEVELVGVELRLAGAGTSGGSGEDRQPEE